MSESDIIDGRRGLISLREKHGALTAIGRRCSSIVEMLENYQVETDVAVRTELLTTIKKHTVELAKLTA